MLAPRVFAFLAFGVLIYLAITFWPLVRPYLRRPGVLPLAAGAVIVTVAQGVMNWYDPIADNSHSSKFGSVRTIVDKTPSNRLGTTTFWFFDWLGWTLLAVAIVVTAVAVVVGRLRLLGYLTAVAGVLGAAAAYFAHDDVVTVGGQFDHSLGPYVDMVGFLVMAGAGITAARAKSELADTKGFQAKVIDWRPGMPFVVLGLIFGLLAYLVCCWFSPNVKNANFADSGDAYTGTAISSLGSSYLSWLGWTLFLASLIVVAAASYLRNRMVAWAGLALSVVGVICTFFTIKSMTNVAAKVAPQNGANWKNLGVGGYLAGIVFMLLAAAAVQVTAGSRSAPPRPRRRWPSRRTSSCRSRA